MSLSISAPQICPAMLKLLIDENLYQRILRGLRVHIPGPPYAVVQDTGLAGAPDASLLQPEFASGRRDFGTPRPGLARPQPSERAGCEERVDQTVHRRLDRYAPGAAVPNRHLPQRHRVAEERGGSGESEDVKVGRADRQRAPRHVGGESTQDTTRRPVDAGQCKPRRGPCRLC